MIERLPASLSCTLCLCSSLMKDVLGDRVEKVVVSERLEYSPCILGEKVVSNISEENAKIAIKGYPIYSSQPKRMAAKL